MQVTTGTVISGKVVVECTTLLERAVVAVLSRGAEEGFMLSTSQEDELLAAMAEIERGDFVGLEELIASLPKPR
jgi:predicted transcriptional regulator